MLRFSGQVFAVSDRSIYSTNINKTSIIFQAYQFTTETQRWIEHSCSPQIHCLSWKVSYILVWVIFIWQSQCKYWFCDPNYYPISMLHLLISKSHQENITVNTIKLLDAFNSKETAPYGKPWSVSIKKCLKELNLRFGFVKGDFRKESKNWGLL